MGLTDVRDRVTHEQPRAEHEPPLLALAQGVDLDVPHDALQEHRRHVEQHRADHREHDDHHERARVHAHEPVQQLQPGARGRAPGADAEAEAVEGGAHERVDGRGAHHGLEDGQVADLERLGGVAEHDDFGGVGEEEVVPYGRA